MSLVNELKERRTAVSAEMDRLEEEGRGIDRQWKEQERLFDDLDKAITALDPTDWPTAEEMFGNATDEQPELCEAEQEVASEQLEADHALPPAADDVVAEEPSELFEAVSVEEAPALTEAEPEQPVEGYAPVTNPEADQVVSAMSWYSPKEIAQRNEVDVFALFRREKEEC